MAIHRPEDSLTLFDSAPLNRRYWVIFALMAAVLAFDFFDFVVVGYLLAAVAPEWHLTYGQSAVILYSGGIGGSTRTCVGCLADALFQTYVEVPAAIPEPSSLSLLTIAFAGLWLLRIRRSSSPIV